MGGVGVKKAAYMDRVRDLDPQLLLGPRDVHLHLYVLHSAY